MENFNIKTIIDYVILNGINSNWKSVKESMDNITIDDDFGNDFKALYNRLYKFVTVAAMDNDLEEEYYIMLLENAYAVRNCWYNIIN